MDFRENAELVREYVEITLEALDELDNTFLLLEKSIGADTDGKTIEDILEKLHSLKGSSGMMGYASIQKFAHKLEDIFKAVESDQLKLNPNLIDRFFRSIKLLRSAVSGITVKNPSDPGIDSNDLDEFISEKIAGPKINPEQAAAARKEGDDFAAKKSDVIKVDFERLDSLLNLVGELVIYNNKMGQHAKELKDSGGEQGAAVDLFATSELIGKITGEIHEAIMKIRMIPLRHVFVRFPRFIRDLAREKGKDVSIFFEGEDTDLDKTIIDRIGDPLIHLLKNAVDHGIELPQERIKNGKTPQGTIIIRAYQESSYIIISVEDNGRGVDEDRLRKKAFEAGILIKEEIDQRDLLDLIFIPGLSTAEKVSEVSGRGLGMDIVKKAITSINGSVEVESEKNVGTRFTIKLPLTLAIVSALMIAVAKEQYAVPLASVVESVKISEKDIHIVSDCEVIRFRGRILPLIRLSDFLGLGSSAHKDKMYVVIVQSASRQLGFVVDSLIGQSDIVIRGLDEYISNTIGISGATILGDGKIVLILDVDKIMENVRHGVGKLEKQDYKHAR